MLNAFDWPIFIALLLLALGVDLFVHRKDHVIRMKEALLWSAFWIACALLFAVFVYVQRGADDAITFLTGYLIEESLSVDNLFVFVLIFDYFCTPTHLLHRVLFWGVVGAILMRGAFIAVGIAILQSFHWVIYVFGAFLVVTGINFGLEKDKKIDPKLNPVLLLARRFFSITDTYSGQNFFVKINGRSYATPLFIVLLAIESSDVIFAVDSIPAILAITYDPFIAYTSNVFAILGLRSLFFAISGMMGMFEYLHYGLALILVFIGVKMLLSHFVLIPVVVTLAVVIGILLVTVLISAIARSR